MSEGSHVYLYLVYFVITLLGWILGTTSGYLLLVAGVVLCVATFNLFLEDE